MKKFRNWLKNRLYIVVILSVLCFFQHCIFINAIIDSEENEVVFDPWKHPVYEKGDTLTFSNGILVDSFIVLQSEAGDVRDFGASFEETYDAYEGLIKHLSQKDSCRINFIIHITPFYYYYYYYYGQLPVQYKGESDIWNGIDANDFEESATIRQLKINDLYNLNFEVEQFSEKHIEVTSALLSKSLGYVQYTKHTGEVFTISEETLKMLMAREWPVPH